MSETKTEDPTAKLLARLAALETELSGLRSAKREMPDPDAIRKGVLTELIRDPAGFLMRNGGPVDHVTKVLVAHAMGDSAPPELKVLAQLGPQYNAQSALESRLEQLSRQVSEVVETSKAKSTRESFRALSGDKQKYPHLSKALAADPSLFDDEVGKHGGSAEDLAANLEGRLTKLSSALGPRAASEENAGVAGQSEQVKPALAGAMSGNPPPLPQQKQGVFTSEDHQKLRDEIVRKYSSQ